MTLPKVVVVMPAFNAGRTLRMTYAALPHDRIDLVILVDDASTDETVRIARDLQLQVFVHDRNYGYGANQKTCYREALNAGAGVIVMVHPDYQYDPTLLPDIIRPILEGNADVVLGSRLLGGSAVARGMPLWKFVGNRVLTLFENAAFGLHLAEYHTGYRAFRREVLERVNYSMNSDAFVFDQEIIAQTVAAGFRISEIPIPTRYLPEASSATFLQSARYGISILLVLIRYVLHTRGIWRQRFLLSLADRYRRVAANEASDWLGR